MDRSIVPQTTGEPGLPYLPIDQAHQEIRLLEIRPGAFDDDLVMTVRVKRLGRKHPTYGALSYVWGKETCPRPALLNGRPISIGRNLDCALRHVRDIVTNPAISRGLTILLWIDALCINRDDVGERNQQVQLMDKIYSLASNVLVWLGPERDDTQFVLK